MMEFIEKVVSEYAGRMFAEGIFLILASTAVAVASWIISRRLDKEAIRYVVLIPIFGSIIGLACGVQCIINSFYPHACLLRDLFMRPF
jgi:intracellular septation protein A